jgi:hypothetical protein
MERKPTLFSANMGIVGREGREDVIGFEKRTRCSQR